jgi:hypothetical protein
MDRDGACRAFVEPGPASFGGMALYFFMLTRGTAARTTSNFYLVPGVTALMAWLFLGERLSLLVIVGLVTASIGCFLVSAPRRGYRPRRKRPNAVVGPVRGSDNWHSVKKGAGNAQ